MIDRHYVSLSVLVGSGPLWSVRVDPNRLDRSVGCLSSFYYQQNKTKIRIDNTIKQLVVIS